MGKGRHRVRGWLGLLLCASLGCGDDFACLDAEAGERLRDAVAERAPDRSPSERSDLIRAFARAECDFEVDALLLLAVAEQESSLDPKARGPAGGIGLLQVRPPTGEATARDHRIDWRGEESLLDPATNTALGAAYLVRMKERFGTWEAALAAYNLGPARLRQLIAKGLPATSPYAREILARKRKLEGR